MTRSPLRGRSGRSLAKATLLAVLFGALAFAIAGLVPGSGQRLRHAAAGWIAVEVMLELTACLCNALLFHGVFSHGAYRIGYVRGAQIALGELGAFVVVPTGAVIATVSLAVGATAFAHTRRTEPAGPPA